MEKIKRERNLYVFFSKFGIWALITTILYIFRMEVQISKSNIKRLEYSFIHTHGCMYGMAFYINNKKRFRLRLRC